METIPKLSESVIRARFDAQTWQRGREYARDGAILHARRQGMTLKAACMGSRPEPYRVEVTFVADSIASADCSCPVGEEGYCKHVAALLLIWQSHPETFVALEELNAALERRDKAELIVLIKQMLRRHPDLEVLLETPPSCGDLRQEAVNPQLYRRQVATLLDRSGYEWGDDVSIGWNLREMVANGDGYKRQGNYEAATAVYTSIASEIMEHYETLDHEEGTLSHVVVTCAAGLGECLKSETADEELRAEIIEALFGIESFDMEWGRLDADEDIPDFLVRYTTESEKQLLAGWVREQMPPRSMWGVDYRRRAYGELLLDLETDTLDDAAFLRVCRESGLTDRLIDRLLSLGRCDEAGTEAEAASDHELLGIADLFVQHGERDAADRLVRARAEGARDLSMLRWLKDQADLRGDGADALDLARRIFDRQPGLAAYQEIRQRARDLGRWEEIRSETVAFLRQPKYRGVLIAVALDEGDIDQAIMLALDALTTVPTDTGIGLQSFGTEMTLPVAKAAEETRPRSAREIYQYHIEKAIAGRNRENYRQASAYLLTVHKLYDRLDEHDRWQQYLAGLREKYRTLRALKEEMIAAGVLD